MRIGKEIVSRIATDHKQETRCGSAVWDTMVQGEGCGCTVPGTVRRIHPRIREAGKSKYWLEIGMNQESTVQQVPMYRIFAAKATAPLEKVLHLLCTIDRFKPKLNSTPLVLMLFPSSIMHSQTPCPSLGLLLFSQIRPLFTLLFLKPLSHLQV